MFKYDITASIVLFNTPQLMLEQVVASFFSADGEIKRHLYLIDNAPGGTKLPPSLKDKKLFTYIPLDKNRGFGTAHNIAIKASFGISRYHVVLNPDIVFTSGTLSLLTAFMDENEDVIECMPRIVYPDGEIQRLCKLLPTPLDLFWRRFGFFLKRQNKLNSRYELHMFDYSTIMDIPSLSGCFMFFRLSTLQAHCLFFDEGYFMYLEDFDLIRRCGRAGRTVFFPHATVIHNHQKQSYKSRKLLIEHIKSAFRYFRKFGWFIDHERSQINRKTLQNVSSLSREKAL